MSIITGIASYLNGVNEVNIYLRMLVSLFIFYMLGIYVRHSIKKLMNEIEKQKNENSEKNKSVQKDSKK
jgi:cell division protein FtsL